MLHQCLAEFAYINSKKFHWDPFLVFDSSRWHTNI